MYHTRCLPLTSVMTDICVRLCVLGCMRACRLEHRQMRVSGACPSMPIDTIFAWREQSPSARFTPKQLKGSYLSSHAYDNWLCLFSRWSVLIVKRALTISRWGSTICYAVHPLSTSHHDYCFLSGFIINYVASALVTWNASAYNSFLS